jgi:acetylornithine aminotransferase
MADTNCPSPLVNSYSRLPVNFVRGEGACLWDSDNREYLDALGGIAVCALGHAHPKVTEAITQQAQTLLHTSNLFAIENQENLAAKLCELSGMEAVFFCNSGAEANEAAIKLSRLHARRKNISAPVVITFNGSFHGRTMATLSATGNTKVHDGFAPLVDGFLHLPYNDLAAIESAAETHDNIVAVMVEPILGEGGIVVPDENYLAGVRQLCEKHDWLFIADEIQTGVGRTGQWYASQHLKPDVITSAKALGNGIPIGACLTRGQAAHLIQPGHHGTTFGGNPFATRVGLTVLQVMESENLPTRAQSAGNRLISQLKESLHNRPEILDIRGKGMMIGIELDLDCSQLVSIGLAHGVVFNVAAGNVLRMLPPYNLADNEIDEIARRVTDSINELCHNQQQQSANGSQANS